MKKTQKPDAMLIRFPMADGKGWMTFSSDQLEQMPKKRLAALQKFRSTSKKGSPEFLHFNSVGTRTVSHQADD